MAITFDNATGAGGIGVASLQWTHTVGAANAFAGIGGYFFAVGGGSSGSLNNVTFTKQSTQITNVNQVVNFWAGSTGAAGNQTVSVTTTGGVGMSCAAGICTYIGVSQATPFSSITTASVGTAATVANFSMSSTAGEVCIVFVGVAENVLPGVTDPQTNRLSMADSTTGHMCFLISEKAGGTNTTSFSFSSNAVATWGFTGFALSATAVAAATFIYSMGLLGVGM